MAQTAYARSAAPIRTDRGTEYDAFARITAALRSTAASAKKDFPALVRALHENRRLWTLLGTSVADPENKLPQDLRGRIFYLAEFSQQHTSKVLDGSASADILVEINTSVMKGLRSQAQAA